jgi:hypothetical protein
LILNLYFLLFSEIKNCDSEIEYLLNPDETLSENTTQIKGLNKEQVKLFND